MSVDVVITGVGLVSSLGEGLEPHLEALRAGAKPVVDHARFAPYPVHPLAAVDFDRQIPKKSDQRQMEPWQRIGVFAAGLALDAAGIKDRPELKDRLQVIVAAGGGERDHAVDGTVLTGLKDAAQPGAYLNERLMSDLRPTLFLAQLSNLLAGNISIVHGVTGASRTFMGEEQAGVDAIRVAQARIAAGQADMILVGGSYNAERQDMLLLFELGGTLRKAPFRPVFDRADAAGMITGSMGAFLVLESAAHAQARGATALARIGAVAAGRARRGEPGAVTALMRDLVGQAGPAALTLTAATGVEPATTEEAAALPAGRRVAIGDLVGHGVEAAFPMAVGLAAALVAAGDAEASLVTGAGHWRGEGAVRVARA